MRILFCAYREWGLHIYNDIKKSFEQMDVHICQSENRFNELILDNSNPYDLIVCAGWSWKIKGVDFDKSWVVGLHPSDLPNFSGGSPIQNQILNNIEDSMLTLYKLNEDFDTGDIIEKKPLPLDDHMNTIFNRMRKIGTELISNLINNFPDNVILTKQLNINNNNYKRLKPEQSKLLKKDLLTLSTKDLYNFIRCRENPYPNAFIEDDEGRLYFTLCDFKPVEK